MTKVAVASRSFSRHPVLRRELSERYQRAKFNDEGKSFRGPDLIEYLRGHDKAVIALESIDAAVLAALPELRVISKYGVGFDKIDLHAMIRHGVSLGWTGGVNRRSVAELIIGFAISLLRLVPQVHDEMRNGIWRQAVGRQLSDRTVAVIGCGNVGQELTRMLRAGFGCKVLVNDIIDKSDFCADVGARQVELDEALSQADIVTLLLPYDVTTANILNRDTLSRMREDAILINTARGGLIDEDALFGMLSTGRLGGAALDVFAVEPPENEALISLTNVLVTPHIGGSAEEAILAMGRAAIQGLDDFRIPEPGVFPPGRW